VEFGMETDQKHTRIQSCDPLLTNLNMLVHELNCMLLSDYKFT